MTGSALAVWDFYARQPVSTLFCFAAAGCRGIARYLVEQPAVDPRALQKDEIADAHSVGLAVHMVYEMNPTYATYFTLQQGQHDARAALFHARYLEAPSRSVVYFAVDAPPSTVPPDAITPYFNGVEDVLANEGSGDIIPGIYGFEAHIEHARAHFPNVGKHLWQTYGTPQGPLDLWQHEQRIVCGVEVDLNDSTVEGWKGTDMTADEVRALIAEYGQRLETSELLPMKQEIEALRTHFHEAGVRTSLPKQPS